MSTNQKPAIGAKTKQRLLLAAAFALAALMLASLALPFVCYTSGGVVYALRGFHFLFGTTIAGGEIAVRPSALIWAATAAALAAVALLLLRKRLGRRTAGLALLAAVVLAIVAAVAFSMRVENALSLLGAKRVGGLSGHLGMAGCASLLSLYGLYLLHRAGTLPRSFDIAGVAIMAAASLAVPYATLTRIV